MSKRSTPFIRPQAAECAKRLAEPRRFIIAVAGPRQAGQTTLVRQVIEGSGLTARFASADEPTLRGPEWLPQQWEAARVQARDEGERGAVLVIDEVQKLAGWAEVVQPPWDEYTAAGVGGGRLTAEAAGTLVGGQAKSTMDIL